MATSPFLYGRPSLEVGHLATAAMQTGSAASGYPATNINNWTIGNETTPGKGSAAVATAWVLDFTSAQRVDGVVLWHNFDAAITIRVQMNAANTWGGPTVDASITVPAKHADGFSVKLFVDLRTVSGYTTSGLRYLRVSVPSATVAPGLKILAYSQWGQLQHNVLMTPSPRQPETQKSIIHATDFDYEWVYQMYSAKRRIAGSVLATSTDLADLRTWFQDCGGHSKVTAFVLNPLVNDAMIVRWRADGTDGLVTAPLDPALHVQGTPRHALALEFDELTAGMPEWT